MEGGSTRRRRHDAGRGAMAGLTLEAVLGGEKRSPERVQVSRSLLDIIRDEEPNAGPYKDLINHHNRKSWKSFKDRLRLRHAGAAWTSSVHIPTSDVSIQNCRSQLSRHHSTRIQMMSPPNMGESTQEMAESEDSSIRENVPVCDAQTCRPPFSRHLSTRVNSFTAESDHSMTQSDDSPVTDDLPAPDVPLQNSRSQILRRNSSRIPSYTSHSSRSIARLEDSSITRENIGTEFESGPSVRLSVALAAEREEQQRAALSTEDTSSPEADNRVDTAEELAVPQTEAAAPVRMSLMDLLEETDRQMGWSSYMAEVEEEEEEEEDDNGGDEEGRGAGGGEYNCCVCMVRHKGAAFIPCGHTFCRLCSRELWVSRGNCPLCNGFILEILDIF